MIILFYYLPVLTTIANAAPSSSLLSESTLFLAFLTRTIFVPQKRKCLAISGRTLIAVRSIICNVASVIGNLETGTDSPKKNILINRVTLKININFPYR
jgi:hypothetical protein